MSHSKRLQSSQLNSIADHIAARRETILKLWRKADRKDPEQTTGRALTQAQFRDHIPEMLDAFESRLRAQSGGAAARAADTESKEAGTTIRIVFPHHRVIDSDFPEQQALTFLSVFLVSPR